MAPTRRRSRRRAAARQHHPGEPSRRREGSVFHHFELATAPYVARNRDSASIKRVSLDPNEEILPGWRLTLDVTADGYWFMVKDVKDPCGFAYVSNKAGLIYTAQHLR